MHIVQVCPTKNKKYYVNLSTLIFKWKNYFQQRTAARSAEIKKKERTVKKKKENPLNLDCSVEVLTLDVSLDVGANNCLLQLNALAEIELCVQRRPAHRADKEAASQMELTGLHRDEIFKVWLVDKLTRPSSSALSCPSSLPCQWPISKSRFHNLLLQTYCLVSIFGRARGLKKGGYVLTALQQVLWVCYSVWSLVLWVSWDLLEMYGSLPSPRLSSWVSFNYS